MILIGKWKKRFASSSSILLKCIDGRRVTSPMVSSARRIHGLSRQKSFSPVQRTAEFEILGSRCVLTAYIHLSRQLGTDILLKPSQNNYLMHTKLPARAHEHMISYRKESYHQSKWSTAMAGKDIRIRTKYMATVNHSLAILISVDDTHSSVTTIIPHASALRSYLYTYNDTAPTTVSSRHLYPI